MVLVGHRRSGLRERPETGPALLDLGLQRALLDLGLQRALLELGVWRRALLELGVWRRALLELGVWRRESVLDLSRRPLRALLALRRALLA
jgi:hypothetical protein